MNPLRSTHGTVEQMVRRIVDHVHPNRIILFGSYARGTPHPDSDVDLLVVMPKNGSKRRTAVDIYRLLAGMGTPKDVIVVTPEEVAKYQDVPGTLIYPAVHEGRVVYDAQPAGT